MSFPHFSPLLWICSSLKLLINRYLYRTTKIIFIFYRNTLTVTTQDNDISFIIIIIINNKNQILKKRKKEKATQKPAKSWFSGWGPGFWQITFCFDNYIDWEKETNPNILNNHAYYHLGKAHITKGQNIN